MGTSLLKLDKNGDISTSRWDNILIFFGDIPGMLVHWLYTNLIILYVSQSVSWLNSLLKLNKSRDISSSGWDFFLIFFGDIPGMLVHYFQIILNFFYVCHSVGWLTSLLKIDKYRYIWSSGWDIFLKYFRDIPGTFTNYF